MIVKFSINSFPTISKSIKNKSKNLDLIV